MVLHSESTKSLAMGVLEATNGNVRHAVRLMAAVYGRPVTAYSVRRWRDDGQRADPHIARELTTQLATVRMATLAPLLEPLQRRVRREAARGTAQDLRHSMDALQRALLTMDPAAAPGGQRALGIPAGVTSGFLAWGPVDAAVPGQEPMGGGAGQPKFGGKGTSPPNMGSPTPAIPSKVPKDRD